MREEDEEDQLQEHKKQFDRMAKTVNELVSITDTSTKTIKKKSKNVKHREWKVLDERRVTLKGKAEIEEITSVAVKVDFENIQM